MLALALILDLVFGDPDRVWKKVPHPVVLIGRLIDELDDMLNKGALRRAKGVAALLAVIVAVWVPAMVLSLDIFFGVFEILGAAILLAQRSLIEHVRAVAEGLRHGLDEGRRAVSRIVGRDPHSLDAPGVSRAAIESGAENFSDGVVAPAFWFLVGGLPAMAVYKAINTADSMIGHRTERHGEFGWAAARLDDLVNWVPARIAGGLICLIGGRRKRAFEVMLRDADLHRSPNAGWPESAMAASLDIALAGPRIYGGETVEDPWLNVEGRRDPGPAKIDRSCDLLWRAWAVLVGISALLWLVF